jgi:hypothetical protein
LAVSIDPGAADGIDAMAHAMEEALVDAVSNGFLAPAELDELPTADNPVLPPGEREDLRSR